MSNFSSAHTVTKYDSKKSQSLTGQRLSKVMYKSSGKSPAKYPSVCASVPMIPNEDVIGNMQALVPAIRRMLESAQDGILKSLYESSDGMLSQVTDTDLSISACIGYMEAEASGNRMTKEIIESWFQETMQEIVYALIGEKLGYLVEGTNEITEEQDSVINKHVNGYKGLYSSLAGGKTILQETQVKSLVKVLELADTDAGGVSEKLMNRLIGMNKKERIEDLLEL